MNTAVGTDGEEVENLELLSHVVDERVGGRQIDATFARTAATKFADQLGLDSATDILASPKARVKLMAAVNKLKTTLSASKTSVLKVENIYQDQDAELEVDRELFESSWEHLIPSLTAPIDEALTIAGVSATDLDTVEIIGGVVRVPKVQEVVKEHLSVDELGWHLNADEAMAHGAALHAANVSSSIEVRPIWFTDISTFDIYQDIHVPGAPANFTELLPAGTRLGQGNIVEWRIRDDYFSTVYTNNYGRLEPVIEYNSTGIKEIADTHPGIVNMTTFIIMYVDFNGMPGFYEAYAHYNLSLSVDHDMVSSKSKKIEVGRNEVERPRSLNQTEFKSLQDRLVEIQTSETEAARRTEKMNELESQIYFVKDKLSDESVQLIACPSYRA
jgi:molecular chaperone DnaK (HSP70)